MVWNTNSVRDNVDVLNKPCRVSIQNGTILLTNTTQFCISRDGWQALVGARFQKAPSNLVPSVSHLSLLGLVLAVLGEEVREDVAAAAGHMDQRPLFPQAEAGRHSQHQRNGLDHKGPLAQITPDDEPAKDGFYLEHSQGHLKTESFI